MPRIKITIRREVTTICETTITADAPDNVLDDYGQLHSWVQREIVHTIAPDGWKSNPSAGIYYTVRDYTIDRGEPPG